MRHTRWTTLVCAIFLTVSLPALAGGRRLANDQSVQARLGAFFVEGESDFWDDNVDIFTLEPSDFDDVTFGMTYSHSFNRFFELDLNTDFFDQAVVSEYNDFVDGSGFPILHDSSLEMIPVTVGVRFLPFGRAKAGKKKPVFFVGAGGGVNFWQYEEVGDFIDFADPGNPIVFGVFSESGEAFVGYATAGLELPITHGMNIGFETRWFNSDDKLGGDFAGLGEIDLSGFSASVSANWRF